MNLEDDYNGCMKVQIECSLHFITPATAKFRFNENAQLQLVLILCNLVMNIFISIATSGNDILDSTKQQIKDYTVLSPNNRDVSLIFYREARLQVACFRNAINDKVCSGSSLLKFLL